MCFSAEVSFGSALVLISAGAWCMRTAIRRAPWLRPLAIVPCLFGVQQASEGLVWVGLHHNATGLVEISAGVFLFFALAFWPIWFSVAMFLIESEPRRRKFLLVWAMLSTAWLVVIFLPLLGEYAPPHAEVVHHSIHYKYADLGGRWQSPLGLWVQRLLYILTVTVPVFTSSAKRLMLPPLGLSILSAIVTVCLFDYAFTSVWCLWSALVSLWLIHAISTAPKEPPNQSGGPRLT